MPASALETEFAPHFHAWKDAPSPETTDALLGAVQPVINSALHTYGGSSATSPTLRGRAKILTLNALERYDPARAKLRTHLMSNLQSLRRHAAREEQAIRIPEAFGLDRLHLQRSTDELKEKLGREPSDHELADHAGLSLKRMERIRKLPGSFAESALTRMDEEGAGMWAPPVQVGVSSKMREAWIRTILADSSPTDALIMERSLGLNGHKPLQNQEIARLLKISPGAVSQRKNRLQEKLDSIHMTGLIGE